MANTSSRTLRLLSLLQSRRHWPGSTLAERLDVSARTLRRDVDRLRELGYPVQASPGVDGGYALAPGAVLPPLVVDDEEAMALAVAIQSHLTTGEAGAAGLRALTKIVQVMPRRLRTRLDAVRTATTPAPWQGELESPVDHTVLTTLALGCRDAERVRFGYRSLTGTTSVRRVEPHQLVCLGQRWYLVAYDLDRADWRTFRIDRISDAEATGARFAPREPPFADVAAFVRAGVSGGSARGRYQVEVEVSAPAEDVRSRLGRWAEVRSRTPTSCTMTMETDDLTGPLFALGTTGADFQVVAPAELARLATDWGRRLLAAARCDAEPMTHDATTPVAHPSGLNHVRLTVTDISRSKPFYQLLLGTDPAIDFSDQADDPTVREDQTRFYGGSVFMMGEQILGLRPGATAGDRFDSTRVGLDHLSLSVGSVADLHAAAERLTTEGIEHGEVIELAEVGMAILSVQDPDGINLELMAAI